MFTYPQTRREPVVDQLHGVSITDPYRWLEDGESPEVLTWTEAQNRFTDSVLHATPYPASFAGRLREVLSGDTLASPTVRGGRVFFLRRKAGQNQPVLCMRAEGESEERVLLDPNQVNEKGTTALDWWYPSPDGRYLAFGYSENGDEWSTLQVLATDTGETLAERIPRTRHTALTWEPDSSGFYYTRYPLPGEVEAGQENYNRHCFYHKLGRPWQDDPKVFGEGMPPRVFIGPSLHDGGRWLLIHVNHGWNSTDLYLMDRAAPEKGFVTITKGRDALFQATMLGGVIYALTNYQAPRYRIIAIDPANPAEEHWRAVVPESESLSIQDFTIANGQILFTGLKDVVARLYHAPLEGGAPTEIPLPPLGSVTRLSGEKDGRFAYIAWESFTSPSTIYRLDTTSAELSLWAQSRSPVDPDQIAVKQVFYPSKDGTRVPMFILHRKDLVPNGDLPTVLTGYGGFNLARTPIFAATIYPWLERGGVWAVANLRGGSEYGEEWHRAGMLGNKQNVFDDFISAAEYLIAQGYTRPERLGISGGSNGGLLMGAAFTQRPDLYKAVFCAVPLLDMVRYHKFLIGALWTSEYGSPDEPEAFRWLHAYSPYHHVEEGTRYPAIFFHTAASDSRVDPCHARKMAALVQEANGSENPILLRIEFEAGHGAGKPVAKLVQAQAETWGFFAWQLGL
ncbi:MAG: prolyl oligopeptidase family serine peptidase [Bacillota bacterium]